MSEHDTTQPRWGDPDAAFPYCLNYEEYSALMTEVATRGLTAEQLGGVACVRCSAAVSQPSEVGQLDGQWRNTETGETIEAVSVLVACDTCRPSLACPWWCAGGHEPFVRGNRHLSYAIHATTVERVEDVLGTGDGSTDVSILQHEDEDEVYAPYINTSDSDLHLDATKARRFAAALLNAADRLDEITGGAR